MDDEEIVAEHDRIVAEEGYCWHPATGAVAGYRECAAVVWMRHYPTRSEGGHGG